MRCGTLQNRDYLRPPNRLNHPRLPISVCCKNTAITMMSPFNTSCVLLSISLSSRILLRKPKIGTPATVPETRPNHRMNRFDAQTALI